MYEEKATIARNVLAGFLEHCLKQCDDLQLLFAYHDFGDSGEIPHQAEYLSPTDLRTWKTEFNHREFFIIVDD